MGDADRPTFKVLACPIHGTEFMGAVRCYKMVGRTSNGIRFCHKAQEIEVVPLTQAEAERDQALAKGAEEERERLRPVIDAARHWYAEEHLGALPSYPVDDPARQLGEALAALDTSAPSEPADPTEGLPPDLAKALRDPTIIIDRDREIKLPDGRTLADHLEEWRNAPSNTASGGLPAPSEPESSDA